MAASKRSVSAARELVLQERGYSGAPMSFVQAVVYAFLYEFLTYDDDEASIEKIEKLLLAYANHQDPEIKAFFTNPDTNGPYELADKPDVMNDVRKAVAEQFDQEFLEDSQVYKTLVAYCAGFFGDKNLRYHQRNFLENLEEVFHDPKDPNSFGKISDTTYKDPYFAMPDLEMMVQRSCRLLILAHSFLL